MPLLNKNLTFLNYLANNIKYEIGHFWLLFAKIHKHKSNTFFNFSPHLAQWSSLVSINVSTTRTKHRDYIEVISITFTIFNGPISSKKQYYIVNSVIITALATPTSYDFKIEFGTKLTMNAYDPLKPISWVSKHRNQRRTD